MSLPQRLATTLEKIKALTEHYDIVTHATRCMIPLANRPEITARGEDNFNWPGVLDLSGEQIQNVACMLEGPML